ncbi:MAG: hypothetical protein BWY90_00618 [Deltaproteobacteria bacterium ADurb.BinA014]|nr:MAG: hypothetical protein BWY90_00618 [Deltaproteobacteria bacterium ADurb.BinA014]
MICVGPKRKEGSFGAFLGVKREGLIPSRLICCRLVMPVILVDNIINSTLV